MAVGVAVVAVPTAASALTPKHLHIYRSSLTAAQIKQYSQNANKRVIVLLRNQFASTLGGGTAELNVRSAALARSQGSITHELHTLNAPHLKQFHFINAVSGTVSALEAKRLKSNPDVLAVVPDRMVKLPASPREAKSSAARSDAAPPQVNTTKGICGTAKKPLLEPEALSQIAAAQAHSGITGKGVKIAVFPDGLDPNLKDFVRRNGQHAIFDYRDFTGDGPNGVTSGGEAFGDASSLISQGRVTYDLSKVTNPNLPLPKNCDIRVKGAAPGASLAVMKVFGGESSPNSTILAGLDFAVTHDHVNVLSQSFGGNPIPQDGTDPVSMFDQEAVKHGITVLASTGDAGITNTIGSPSSTGKGIIGVGATSSFRSHAQVSEHGYQLGGFKGWESNNTATLSSTGFTSYGPNSVDVVAPGDSGWSDCSPNINRYFGCANEFGAGSNAPPVLLFGGTSESCPLTAGVAALVIQAFRSTHKGRTPAPGLVKRILMSTASDIGAPAEEQGAGQVNASRAVALARSYKTKPHGHNLLLSTTKIEKTAAPGTTEKTKFTVQNQGSSARKVTPVAKRFGASIPVLDTTVNLDSTSANPNTFTYWLDGNPEPYVEKDFTVPGGLQRLDARFGFPADGQEVFIVLFDPKGKKAQDSDPQGVSGFGQDDVQNPMPGKWRAILFSRPASDKYSGPIALTVTGQKLVKVNGSVFPASRKIPAGQSRDFTVKFHTPAKPGDGSEAVYFGSGVGALPILTRSTVPVKASTPGKFSGELTTGNGRMSLPSQEQAYQFDVPANVKDIDVDVKVADPGYVVIGSLIDPQHGVMDSQSSTFVDLTQGGTETEEQTVHLSWANPKKGRWEFDLATVGGSTGTKTSTTFTGNVAFNTVQVTSSGVPNGTATSHDPGTPIDAQVTVTNTGNSPEIYYLDARSTGSSTYSLGFFGSPNGTVGVDNPQAILPPESSSLTVVATATKKVQFSTSPFLGTPEILSTQGKTAVASVSRSPLEASEWSCGPGRVGPFSGPASSATFSCGAFASTHTINDDIAAQGGNLWDNATDPNSPNVFSPGDSVVVAPGDSTTIAVEITPSDSEAGETVHGHLAVQTFNALTTSSDELVNIPYTYKVSEPA
jgi:hypothetical protein